ncbi:MAG: DNA translocase FtsK, partial [Myxococcaceae bacterium]|nr:DNA translocase FtsK [Myxococcaceae bacterium]
FAALSPQAAQQPQAVAAGPATSAQPSQPPPPRAPPLIVQPPSPPPEAFLSLPPQALQSMPPAPVALSMPVDLGAPQAPPQTAGDGLATPLIVEPKAPPKPTTKKVQEQFEFLGGRTSFAVPPLDVLRASDRVRTEIDKNEFYATAEKLRAKLLDFKIDGQVVEIRPGPVITTYEYRLAPGIKISKVASLADDLAMAMEAQKVRIVAPIPGKNAIGIEVPNREREAVVLKEIAEQDAFQKSSSKLALCLGKDIEGMPYVLDLAKAPHLLIAGTTGSGKSVGMNAMIVSMLLKATPEEVRFIMVDPKQLELAPYDGIPHMLLPVVTDPRKAALALQWAVDEMERRYSLLAKEGVRHVNDYNRLVDAEKKKGPKAKRAGPLTPPKPAEAAPAPAVEAKPPEPAPSPVTPAGKKRKLLIVDVDEPVSDAVLVDSAAAPAVETPAAPVTDLGIGVPAPVEPKEEVRVEGAVEDEGEIRIEEITAEERAALEAAAQADEGAEAPAERQRLPFIVVIIDELADLMMVAAKEIETSIARIAQKARAAGIHLIVATQRPSTDIITGVIKANFPTRISFRLAAKYDSMTILNSVGAEKLLGMGDMLLVPPNASDLVRVHGCYVGDNEISQAVDHLKAQGKPVYDESILVERAESDGGGSFDGENSSGDDLYDKALAFVATQKTISVSLLQRRMGIGYNKSANLIERMEKEGIVAAANGAKPRTVLIGQLGQMSAAPNPM